MAYHHFVSKKLTFLATLCIFFTLLPLPYFMIHFIDHSFYFPKYLQEPLIHAFGNGLLLVIITSIFALLWSVPSALFLGLFHLRYKKLWVALLVLPLAIPSYLNAYAYSHLLYYTGTFSMWYQSLTGMMIPFNIRSTIGGGFVLSLSLYPYIFFPLFLRINNFPSNIIDYAQTIGHKKITIIRKLILRAMIPIILFGLTLIMLEVLSDYGTVAYFGINSPSLFLFDIWQQTGDIAVSINITIIYLIITGCIYFFSHYLQRNHNYSNTLQSQVMQKFTLKKQASMYWINGWFFIVLLFGFLVPTGFFLYHLFNIPMTYLTLLGDITRNSFIPAIIAASACVLVGLVLGYVHHYTHSKTLKSLIMLSTTGYALPGVILGITVYIGLIFLNRFYNATFDTSLIFATGSIMGLVICYYIKFLTVSYGSLEPVFKTINPSLFFSALTFGHNRLQAFLKVYLPFLTKPMTIAFIMVIVDILKELPMTLLLRPLGFETFATFTYKMAGLEQVEQASPAALILILAGTGATLLPIILYVTKDSNSESF